MNGNNTGQQGQDNLHFIFTSFGCIVMLLSYDFDRDHLRKIWHIGFLPEKSRSDSGGRSNPILSDRNWNESKFKKITKRYSGKEKKKKAFSTRWF